MPYSKKISILLAIVGGLLLLITLVSPSGVEAADYTVCPEGCLYTSIQAAVDSAAEGDTIQIGPGAYAEHVTIQKSLALHLNGAVLGPGSPAFTVDSDDITIKGPGVLDGAGSSDPAILVQSGANNFILDGVEIRGWRDGVELAGSVTSFKLVNNWFHDNTESGLQVDPGVVLDGVVTVEGNLFKENVVTGIQNDSGYTLDAEYNSWGHIDGPAAGDGVSVNVDADPWNFFEIYMDVDPDSGAVTREILEGDTVDVKLKLDAKNIYGFTFKLFWDSTLLDLNSVTFNAYWLNYCEPDFSTTGEITFLCYLENPAVEYSATGSSLLTLNLSTKTGASLSGNGPWEALFDLSHLESDTSVGAIGGAKVWVNNAGYGAPSTAIRDISDADDGKLVITGLANYSGTVLLEGRTDRSGALVQAFNIADKATSIEMANATSAATGLYYTAHISPNVLILGTNYYLFIDRHLYLPTTIMGVDLNLDPDPIIPATWWHSKLLTTRLYTPLANVLLLGGDATNDNVIDILDAGCIGRDYLIGPGECGVDGSSDVNGDGHVDMLDVTLMAGNYTKNYSPWMP